MMLKLKSFPKLLEALNFLCKDLKKAIPVEKSDKQIINKEIKENNREIKRLISIKECCSDKTLIDLRIDYLIRRNMDLRGVI